MEREEPSEQPCREENTPGIAFLFSFLNTNFQGGGIMAGSICCGFPIIEVPTPLPDDSTTTFTFSQVWDTNLMIFLRNGLVQEFTSGVPTAGQYSVSKPTVTMGTAPFTGDRLLGIYWVP